LLLLAIARSSEASADDSPADGRPRNVLFYLVDTCRADRMSLYGHARETTPFLAKLAARSVVFDRCYAQAPWTKPSMASILTSRPPPEHGVVTLFGRLADEMVTFPEVLHESGFATAGFSANPIMGRWSHFTQGFEWFTESGEVNRADPIHHASGSAKALNEHVFRWLDRREDDGRPVFLYVHSVDPHEEYEPAEPFRSAFADPERDDPYRDEWKALLATRPGIPGNHVTASNFAEAGVEVEPFIAHGRDLYDADVRANDHEIERLFERCREAWGDDFVFVLTSDHGEEFYEHGGTSHGYSLYDEMIHVPLLIHAPGLLPEATRVRSPVRSIDVYPTLLDLVGLGGAGPDDLRGRSLLPLVEDPRSWTDEPAFAEKVEDEAARVLHEGAGIAVSIVRGKWKLVVNLRSPSFFDLPPLELYDLSADPAEQRNLADDHAAVARELRDEALRWSATHVGHRVGADDLDPEDLPEELLAELRALGYLK
ncbi:MAG: sulfatase, partial [Planctomycetota bacterium JB042]